MGLHEWAYSNNYNPAQRQKMKHVDLPERFASMTIEVEQGFTAEQTRAEVERCLNCDIETHFIDVAVHRVRRVHRHLPGRLPDDHAERRRAGPARALQRAGAEPRAAAVRLRAAEADRPRDGEGRERLPALRPVRRALPDLRVGHAQVRAADSVRGQRHGHSA